MIISSSSSSFVVSLLLFLFRFVSIFFIFISNDLNAFRNTVCNLLAQPLLMLMLLALLLLLLLASITVEYGINGRKTFYNRNKSGEDNFSRKSNIVFGLAAMSVCVCVSWEQRAELVIITRELNPN